MVVVRAYEVVCLVARPTAHKTQKKFNKTSLKYVYIAFALNWECWYMRVDEDRYTPLYTDIKRY